MENMKRITRNEAARLLGVSTQAVTNLAKRGALTMAKVGQFQYYNYDEVIALVPKCGNIRDVEASIAAVEKDLQAYLGRAISESRIQQVRKEFIESIAGGNSTLTNFAELAVGLYKALLACSDESENVTERENEVVMDALRFVPMHVTAQQLGLTVERVRQIRNRAIRRIIHFSQKTRKDYEAMRRTRDEASEQAKRLVEENAMLMAENKRLRESGGDEKTAAISMKTDVRDLGFSVRLANHLKAADINTVADILACRRHSIARIRNLGRKSLIELDTWMGANGFMYANEKQTRR